MAMCKNVLQFCIVFMIIFRAACYEITLRKMVRSKSKMVPRPFSETGSLVWGSPSKSHVSDALMFPGQQKSKATFQVKQRPKISTIISSIDSGRSKVKQTRSSSNGVPMELRLARNTANIQASVMEMKRNSSLFSDFNEDLQFNNHSDKSMNTGPTEHEPMVVFPPKPYKEKNNEPTVPIKEEPEHIVQPELKPNHQRAKPKPEEPAVIRNNNQKIYTNRHRTDLYELIEVSNGAVIYHYNITSNPNTCTVLRYVDADIDAQRNFGLLDIEPCWARSRQFWDEMFENRYEALMKIQSWPSLKVILIPSSHVDTIWKKSFTEYHNNDVNMIISNIVKKLQFYKNLTFHWNEVSHMSYWWMTSNYKSRLALRNLIKEGRFEITTGSWVEPDEATTHIFGLVHSFMEGQQWLKQNLNFTPKVAWLTNSVTHSPTMAYLLSSCNIFNLVITNLHYSWQKYLAEYQYSDFLWQQNWDSDKMAATQLNSHFKTIGNDRFPKHTVLTRYLQFDSAGFRACGPQGALCEKDYNFFKSNEVDLNTFNIKERSEALLEQYSKSGTLTQHNIVIAPIGNPYSYEHQSEFDYQFNNYKKIADFINSNQEIYKTSIVFGTPKDYFDSVLKTKFSFKTLKGDFLNYADISSGEPAYWVGYFTTRPRFKILLRILQSILRSTEIIFSHAFSLQKFKNINTTDIFDLLIKSRESVARLQDRNVSGGTLPIKALLYAFKLIKTTIRDCWFIQELAATVLTSRPDKFPQPIHLKKVIYGDGQFNFPSKAVSPGDSVYLFNSLSHDRTEIVELLCRKSNIRIIDYKQKDVSIQIDPVWKLSSNDINIVQISRTLFKIKFAVTVSAMTLEMFKIKETYDASLFAATIYCSSCIIEEPSNPLSGNTFPFIIHPVEEGDIQLESYRFRLIFDEFSGFLKNIVEKLTNVERPLAFDFGAFKSATRNAGSYLFNTNVSKPLFDILKDYMVGTKSKISVIVSGSLTTEMTSIFGKFLQHSVKIFNIMNSPLTPAIFVDSKVDFGLSPQNREIELFFSIQTDISNGNNPVLCTDNNGFQYTERTLNLSRRIESNMYPMTSMVFIQDLKHRLTVITDHAQGVTALQEGQLVVMLDRRILFNDGRGTDEGLADSSITNHRHIILLENIMIGQLANNNYMRSLKLPSLVARHLANAADYQLDMFTVDKNLTDKCYYAYRALVKAKFPCDVAVVNYRVNINRSVRSNYTSNSALITLHRQGLSCDIDDVSQSYCSHDSNFNLENILNVLSVRQSNLCGTEKGSIVTSDYTLENFPYMELLTVQVYFKKMN